jgi:hypothetical protein
MPDSFIIFTPLLVFAIVALFGFVGCDYLLSIKDFPPATAVTRVFSRPEIRAEAKAHLS